MKCLLIFCLFFLLVPLHGRFWTKFVPSAKYFKKNLVLRIPQQNGKTCLPSVMSYLNHELCGGDLDVNYYIEYYQNSHPNILVEEDGMIGTKKELVEFIQSHFETIACKDSGGVQSSIDAGYPILTTIPINANDGQQEVHSILIVGYDSSNKTSPNLYYMDPMFGHIYNNLSLLDFGRTHAHYVLSVLGCKKNKHEKNSTISSMQFHGIHGQWPTR